jgi:hypothetical protein
LQKLYKSSKSTYQPWSTPSDDEAFGSLSSLKLDTESVEKSLQTDDKELSKLLANVEGWSKVTIRGINYLIQGVPSRFASRSIGLGGIDLV